MVLLILSKKKVKILGKDGIEFKVCSRKALRKNRNKRKKNKEKKKLKNLSMNISFNEAFANNIYIFV